MANTKNTSKHTVFAHAAQMFIKTSLVLDKRLVAGLMFIDPVTDQLPQFGVLGWRAVELVGERPEETISVADCICWIETQCPQLVAK